MLRFTPSFQICLQCELVLVLMWLTCATDQHDISLCTVCTAVNRDMEATIIQFHLSCSAVEAGEWWDKWWIEEWRERECMLQLWLFVEQWLLFQCRGVCGCRDTKISRWATFISNVYFCLIPERLKSLDRECMLVQTNATFQESKICIRFKTKYENGLNLI